jgi:hypothetical protein
MVFLWSLVVYGLIAKWYVGPWVAGKPLREALVPLIFPHVFRHVGMSFLVPGVVAEPLPRTFAVPAAYGDLLAAVLAVVSLVALRGGWRFAVPIVWLFNVVGTLDLVNAVYQGVRLDIGARMGATWYIPTLAVPMLLVTHFMVFRLLLRREER